MKVEKESMIHSLWDAHQIIKGVDFRKKFQLASEEQKKQFSHYYFINRLFHHRRTRDPGFFLYVLNEVSNNPEIIQKTISYIRKVIADSTTTYTDFFPHEKLSDTGNNPKPFSWSYSETRLIENSLHDLYRDANERGDIDEAVIIRSQMTNRRVSKPFYSGDQFLDSNHNLDLMGSLVASGGGKWDNEGQFFLTRYLKNINLYQNLSPIEIDAELLKIIENPLVQNFRQAFGIYPESPEKIGFAQSIPRDIRFCRDCVFIASEFWFDSLEINQKIALLNREYSFNVDKNHEKFELSPYHSNQITWLDFYYAVYGFVNEARQMLNLIYSKSSNHKIRSDACWKIGECHVIDEEYSDALKSYQLSYSHRTEYLKELTNSPTKCTGYVGDQLHSIEVNQAQLELVYLLREMGAVHVKKGDFQGSERCIDDALPYLDSITRTGFKETCYLEIAKAYEMCKAYDKELHLLEKCLIEIEKPIQRGWIEGRVTFLKGSEISTLSKEAENKSADEFTEKIRHLFSYAGYAKKAFQYQKALHYTRRIAELNPTPKNLLSLGILCQEMGFYYESHAFFEKIPSTQLSVEDHLTLLRTDGINHILLGETAIGKSLLYQFIDEVAHLMEKSEGDKYAQLQERGILWIFRELLERGISLGDTVIIPIIDEIKEYSLKKNDMRIEELTDIVSFSYQLVGWDEKALDEEMTALATIDERTENYVLFNYFIGRQHLQKGDYKRGVAWLERAIQHPSGKNNPGFRAMAMSELAQTYFQLGKFNEAQEYQTKAEQLNPQIADVYFVQGSKRVSKHLKTKISIESIDNPDVKIIFKNAEKMYHENLIEIIQKNNAELMDLSIILFNYGKGLESLLDAEVWSEIRQIMFEKYSDDGTCIDYGNLYSDLPFYFKGALSMYPETRESVHLGTWGKIILKKNEKHPVVRDINKYLKTRFSKDFEFIRYACEKTSPYRNHGAHKEVITSSDEFLKKREEIIPLINEAIRVVYSRKLDNFSFVREKQQFSGC